jgi:hypothetical protein
MRRGLVAASVAVMAGVIWTITPALADAYRLDYAVNHSKYGNIGAFSNVVDTEGNSTTVTTNLSVQVKILGISAYHQTAQRVEKWDGGRLVFLHSLTTTKGKPVTVDGVAQGDHFMVSTAKGVEQAPANVKVANPWSPAAINGNTIIAPDDGTVSSMQISGPQVAMVQSANGSEPVKQYDIDVPALKEKYQVWFDSSGTPVKFDKIDNGGTVTFTLQSKTPVNPLVAAAQSPSTPETP